MARVIISLLFLATVISAAPVLVLDFLRHGARAPIRRPKLFSNITWKRPGELTPVGERQHYLLGRLRRQQYIEGAVGKLLPEMYDPSTIYARSTYFNRTMMSLQCYLLGLYPTGLEMLNAAQVSHRKDLLAPPIKLTIANDLVDLLGERPLQYSTPMHAIHTVSMDAEQLLLPNSCPYIEKAAAYYGAKKYPIVFHKFDALWKSIAEAYPEITPEYLMTGGNAVTVTDFFLCADAEGMSPPRITKEILEGCKEFLGTHMKEEMSLTPQLIKISMSGVTKEILGAMNKTIEGRTSVKYAVYASHDSSLTIFLVGLHAMNNTISWTKTPAFASNLLFELDGGKEHMVSIYYEGQMIHQEPYEAFKGKFEKVGELGMSREEACSQGFTPPQQDLAVLPIEFD